MKTHLMLLAALGLGVSTATAQPVVRAPGHDLAREGTGDRRAALDRMELKPFDHGNWKLLTDWTGGAALDAANTRGKVVLIYTFTNYLPTSLRPLATVSRLQERFGDDLIVVGVHQDTAWEDTASVLARRNVELLYARDSRGAFRRALLIDEDPDFYVIDRAGQMRFADIETSAVTRAVEILIGESEHDSRTMLETLRKQQAEADREFARPQDIRQEVVLSDIPELPFMVPGPEEYATANWPRVEEQDRNRPQYGEPPPPGSMPQFEPTVFVPTRPEFKGRAVVAYFFNPKVYRSYQFVSEANLLQQAHGRDVVVLGVMTPQSDPNARWQSNPTPAVTAEQWIEDLQAFVRTRTPRHTIVSDFAGQFAAALTSGQQYGAQQTNVLDGAQSPYVAVISSDGVIRWHGPASSRWFKFTLDQVLRVDPGVRARRTVEEEYRRTLLREQAKQPLTIIEEGEDE